MSNPIESEVTFNGQQKDAFIWGYKNGIYSSWSISDWHFMVDERESDDGNALFPTYGFNALYVGRRHLKWKQIYPPESWERIRSYISFNTNGFQDLGYVKSAKLKLYATSYVGHVTTNATPQVATQKNWQLLVFSISGGPLAVQRPYTAGYNPANYGFGDQIHHTVAGYDYTNYDSWGVYRYPANSTPSMLEELVASGMFADFAAADGVTITNNETLPAHKPIGFKGYVEIPLPISCLNDEGETHFRLVNHQEYLDKHPLEIGPTGAWAHEEIAQFAAYEHTNSNFRPKLLITYIAPADHYISNLRLADLSIQRHLQVGIDQDTTFSGITVLDGFPTDPTEFSKARNMSLEHVSSTSVIVEVGSNETSYSRRFFVDLACDQKGELADLTEKVNRLLHGGTTLYDFRYGFQVPKSIGRIHFTNLRTFQVPPLTGPDRNLYHTVVSVDAEYMRSG